MKTRPISTALLLGSMLTAFACGTAQAQYVSITQLTCYPRTQTISASGVFECPRINHPVTPSITVTCNNDAPSTITNTTPLSGTWACSSGPYNPYTATLTCNYNGLAVKQASVRRFEPCKR